MVSAVCAVPRVRIWMVPFCVDEPSTMVTVPVADESVGMLLAMAARAWFKIVRACWSRWGDGAVGEEACWEAATFGKERMSAANKESIRISMVPPMRQAVLAHS